MSSSMFDDLTVSAPALGLNEPGPYSGKPATLPSVLPTLSSATPQPSSSAVIGPTGLIARVEQNEFVKLVSQTAPIVVLYTPKSGSTAGRIPTERYVASIYGTVFITHATSEIRFPPAVTVVAASAVLCNGRPLSNEDFV